MISKDDMFEDIRDTTVYGLIDEIISSGSVRGIIRSSEVKFDIEEYIRSSGYWHLHPHGFYYVSSIDYRINVKIIIMNDTNEIGLRIYNNTGVS